MKVERDEALRGAQEACHLRHPFSPTPLRFDDKVGGAPRLSVVQREGELILIPPGWWHQTYHLEPTVAIAGQYANENNAAGVAGHILDWSRSAGREEPNSGPVFTRTDSSVSISSRTGTMRLLRTALKLRHGRSTGSKLYSSLVFPGTSNERSRI